MQNKQKFYLVFFLLMFLLFIFNKSFSKDEIKTLKTNYLKNQVTIYRDGYGIPYIFAKGDSDLFFAYGYVTAEDRLFQMDSMRRAATGKISEIIGMLALSYDKDFRKLGFSYLAEKQYKALSPKTKKVLNAFVAGINFYINLLDKNNLPALYKDMGVTPSLFTEQDIVALGNFLAYTLTEITERKITGLKILNLLGKEKTEEIFNVKFSHGVSVIKNDELKNLLYSSQNKIPEKFAKKINNYLWFVDSLKNSASNNWAISSKLTKDKVAYLANDPHMPILQPSMWYEVNLFSDNLKLSGYTVPGFPVIGIGHNAKISWGVTVSNLDLIDIYVEKINPENPNQYLTKDGWKDFEKFPQQIGYKSGNTIAYKKDTTYATIHGVVIEKNNNYALSVKAVNADENADPFLPFLEAMQANNVKEFDKALSKMILPTLNFVFADIEGNIGYRATGKVPIRKAKIAALPFAGESEDGQWTGFIPADKMPHVINPPRGFVVTANNKQVDDSYPYYLSAYYSGGIRAKRIEDLIQNKLKKNKFLTLKDMQDIQADEYSLFGEVLLAKTLPVLIKNEKSFTEEQKKALNYLKKWDFSTGTDSIASSIFHSFYNNLLKNTFKDEMEEYYTEFIKQKYLATEVLLNTLDGKTKFNWFENTQENIKTKDEVIVKTFLDVLKELEGLMGKNITDWQWGKIHIAVFENPLSMLGKKNFNIDAGGVSGGIYCVNRTDYKIEKPYDVSSFSSIRFIAMMAKNIQIKTVMPPGENEDISNSHGQDQVQMWKEKKYRPILSAEEIKKVSKTYIVLE